MRVQEILYRVLKKHAPGVHSKRVAALIGSVMALIDGKRLTLTGIARSIRGKCTPKSAIRKIDKLLGNVKLHKERQIYYRALSYSILSGISKPVISIDWTGAQHHYHYCLRASVNLKGRSFVLY